MRRASASTILLAATQGKLKDAPTYTLTHVSDYTLPEMTQLGAQCQGQAIPSISMDGLVRAQ